MSVYLNSQKNESMNLDNINNNNNTSENEFEDVTYNEKLKYNKVVLLNFEDDTFKLVIKINDDYIEIIKSFYKKCNQIIDIEETDIDIPIIDNEDMDKILNRNIACRHKKMFINSYVPRILRKINMQLEISNIESILSNVEPSMSNSFTKKRVNLSELKINLPDNLKYNGIYYYKKDNQIVHYEQKVLNYGVLRQFYDDDEGEMSINKGVLRQTDDNNEMTNINNLNTNIKPYNYDYNVLKPSLVDISFKLTIDNNTENELLNEKTKLIIVLLNPMLLQTIVVTDPDKHTLETIFDKTEYGFIELFTVMNDNEEVEIFIKKYFDGMLFINNEELNKTLLSISHFIELINNKKKNSTCAEEICVKDYIKSTFYLSNDDTKKMKASEIYDIITNSELCRIEHINLTGFKNRLLVYLNDLGLSKKRCDDGYYYYGITKKIKSFEEMMIERMIERTNP